MTPHEKAHSIRAGMETDPMTPTESAVARMVIEDGIAPFAESLRELNPDGRAVVGLCFNIIARVIAGGHPSVEELR